MKRVARVMVVVLGLGFLAAGPNDICGASPESTPADVSASLREAIHWLGIRMKRTEGRVRGFPRIEAVNRLQSMGVEAVPAIPFLIPVLGDATRVTRSQLSEGLPRLSSDFAKPVMTKEDVHCLGAEVARMLAAMGEPALQPLIEALNHHDALVRTHAALGLGEIGDLRAVEPLLGALDDRDHLVRGYAASALGRLRDPRVVEPLVSALGDRNRFVRESAAAALGQTGDPRAFAPLVRALDDGEPSVRKWAAAGLGRTGDPRAVTALIRALSNDKARSVRESAAAALGRIGDTRAVAPLVEAQNKVGEAATLALASIEDPRVPVELVAALTHREPSVRKRAARELAMIGGPKVVEPLLGALDDPEPEVRESAAIAPALLRPDSSRVTNALHGALHDQYHSVRAAAALGLQTVDDPEVLEALVTFVTDRSGFKGETARLTWEALVSIGDPQPLIALLSHREPIVRQRAIGLLREIGDVRAVEPLIAALARAGRADEGKAVALVLGELGDARAVEPLITELEDRRNPAIAGGAAHALGELRDSRAVGPLIAALPLHDRNIQVPAAWALGEIGDLRAVGPLVAAVMSCDWYAQAKAAEVLRKLTGQDLCGFETEKWREWWEGHRAEYEQLQTGR